MKKLLLSTVSLAALLGNIDVSGQEKIGLQKYDYVTNGDANIYQGIPNISLPLFNVEVPTTGISINLDLNYTSESASAFNMISDVGKGWNLSTMGSIVRNKTRIDSDYYTSTTANEAWSDVYVYNYPGGSGKFYIGMDKTTQQLIGVHTVPANDKIIVTKDTSKPNKILSFTIIDNKGNRYLFDKTNINKMYIGDGTSTSPSQYKFINSGFFLSKIVNIKNEEMVNIEYITATQAITSPAGTLQNQKIKKVTINKVGSIEYDYLDNGTPTNLNSGRDADWYTLKKVMLKNTRNEIINQYLFTKLSYLKELSNLDKNGTSIQKFSFEYKNENQSNTDMYIDQYGYPSHFEACNLDSGELRSPYTTDRNSASNGALQRIILPTGGITEYEFEPHSMVDYTTNQGNCTASECYFNNYDFDKIYTLNFDTQINSQYTVNLPSGYQNKLFVKYNYTLHPAPPGNPGSSTVIQYKIGGNIGDKLLNPLIQQECIQDIRLFTNLSGPLNFTFSGLKKGYGTVDIYAAKQQKRDKNIYGYGLRIKSIKNFNPGEIIPVSYTRYEYDTFNDPLLTSGTGLDSSDEISFIDSSPKASIPVGYTNVKMTNMIDGSYSKYYFTSPLEFINIPSTFFGSDDKDMKNYLRTMGLLQKREDYGSGNQLLQKSEFQYEYKGIPLANVNFQGNAVKKINISKQSSFMETYVSGTSKKLSSSSESIFDDTYNYVTSSKETSADGTTVEKTLLYPNEKGIQKLLTANMVDVLLETTIKKNGKLIGKAETKFDDASHLYPTSVLSYNMQTQAPVMVTKLDIYDNKGNLVQTTAKNGILTTTVWGYYQTKPIAVITGIGYAQIGSLPVVAAAVAASNSDFDDPSTEPALILALENLRKDPALAGYSVSATTYDPLVGVTNSISANGIRAVNIYDTANRLIKVTNASGETLQEYQYNYKH
ncbi:hypothetical protein [Chryseobacterium indologenes]|uniref:hypothetical protein n=1 Tax=Chryseobacterium indologenes TaxID=253 RepID=UPI001BD0E404|nr:hypothetical protein [Chryseobacterium indologenes]